MSNSRKYTYRLAEDTTGAASGWTAEIVRRVTAKREAVSKQQSGFATEADARTWAEAELAVFLKLQERKKKAPKN